MGTWNTCISEVPKFILQVYIDFNTCLGSETEQFATRELDYIRECSLVIQYFKECSENVKKSL